MSKTESDAARDLFKLLVDYYDDSDLQPPINVGDALHVAICEYRKSLPGAYLPPGEGEHMRQLLRLSRSDEIESREESKSVAERWAEVLQKKYPELLAERLDVPVYLGNGRVQVPGECEPRRITNPSEAKVLDYLVSNRRVSTKELEGIGISNASKTISDLCNRFTDVPNAIDRPGRRRKGQGYATTIIDGRITHN